MKFLLRLMVWLLLCVLILVLLLLPFPGFQGAGVITDSPAVAGAISVVVLLGISVPVMRGVSSRMPGGKRQWLARGKLAVYLLLTGSLAGLVFLP